MRSPGLGLDGRLVAGLVAVTFGAAGIGFVVAAGLDRTGTTQVAAVPAPAPVLTPEAVDPDPRLSVPVLPSVTVGSPPTATQATTPPTTAPEPAPAQPLPNRVEQVPTQPPPAATTTPPVAPTPSTPSRTTPSTPRPPTTTTAPRANTQPPRPPADDPGDTVPFRPEAASVPLAQFLVPEAEMPTDLTAATATLRAAQKRAPETGTTRTDITHVLELGRRFGNARLTGRQATISRIVRLNAWWYARKRAPANRVLVRDPNGLIYSYAPGRGFAVNPVGTSGRWQRLNEGFSNVQLATTLLELGVSEIRGGRQTLNWEYYDVADQPTAIRPGVSAMAQARVARLMASAYGATGDARFATAAVDAMASLAVDVANGGARSMVAYPAGSAPAPWMVERAYPGADPWKGAALNGFMVTLVELRSTERAFRGGSGTPSPTAEAAAAEARRLADEGAVTLDRYLPAHDSGTWSYYGLLTPGRPFRSYLANATYHCYHVTLLRSLAPQYPAMRFGAFADTWTEYATRAGATCPTNTTPAG